MADFIKARAHLKAASRRLLNAINLADDLRRTLAQVEPVQEPDLSRCPKCNGPADNGHDRSIPPSPYFCTKCMAEPVPIWKTLAEIGASAPAGTWDDPVKQQAEPVQDLIPPDSLFVCDQMGAHVTRVRVEQQAEPVLCDHCSSPLFAARQCRVCGRKAEQIDEALLGR